MFRLPFPKSFRRRAQSGRILKITSKWLQGNPRNILEALIERRCAMCGVTSERAHARARAAHVRARARARGYVRRVRGGVVRCGACGEAWCAPCRAVPCHAVPLVSKNASFT